MNGLPAYSTVDSSNRADSRVSGYGRASVVGTLVHSTSGVDSLNWLLGASAAKGSPASADYLIDRGGQRFKLCPDGRFPYHAGAARWEYNNIKYLGDKVSEILMGIELECLDDERVTWQQVDSLAELIVSDPLAQHWRWPYILIGHYEVALPVGRRSDPLGLDWGALMGRLYVRAQSAGVGGL